MKTVAIIQARMGSTRLPGKVMRDLCGTSVVGWVLRRVQACPLVDEVVVATTTDASDDVVEEEVRRLGGLVYRGHPENVLSRYCGAAAEREAEVVIRVTADCPLYDPEVLTRMLERFRALNAEAVTVDYLSNAWGGRTWPRGLDTEIFTRAALDTVCREATKPYELEHVTPYIYQHPGVFRMQSFKSDVDLSRHRWTLDTIEDWLLIEAIYKGLRDGERIFGTDEVLAFLDRYPELIKLNAHVEQKKLGQ
ncbi:MAG: glycosyltransferase family protein [Chromatiales bacterium]|jgi:spore coat polysaccharide biosynthesis protein SpsF|nr:glycosyltransferase family protein [Chromatiales bacterium]MDX9766134.1 glycosyltransferase family protein [Ectothiorhodospiraceae bacterium]